MREKLLELLKREGLKPSQLAEILEINPAGISHILAGRNKPSFELLQKILRRFPRINPDWLLLDSDQMYRSGVDTNSSPVNGVLSSERSPVNRNTETDRGLFADIEKAGNSASPSTTAQPAGSGTNSMQPTIQPSGARKTNVQRIVIFYEDQTFETYTPASK